MSFFLRATFLFLLKIDLLSNIGRINKMKMNLKNRVNVNFVSLLLENEYFQSKFL